MNYYFIREDDSRCRFMVVSAYSKNAPGIVICRDCELSDAERITSLLNGDVERKELSRPVCPPNTVITSGVIPPPPPPPAPENEDPAASPYRSNRGGL